MDATARHTAAPSVDWGLRLVELARMAAAMHVEEWAGSSSHPGEPDQHGVRGTQAEGLARWAEEARRRVGSASGWRMGRVIR